MRKKSLQILPLAAAGLVWTALAALPGAAHGQMVEKQTSASSGSSGSSKSSAAGSSASRSSSSARSSSRSQSTRSSSRSGSSSARSSNTRPRGSSGSQATTTRRSRPSSDSGARASQGGSSSNSRVRSTPSAPRHRPGGRSYEDFRATRQVDDIDKRQRRTRSQQHRDRHRDRRHERRRSSHRHHYYNNYHRNYYGGHYGYYSYPYRYPYFSYYGAFGFWSPWFDYGWGWGKYPYRRPVTVYISDYDNGRVGALDLDVSPEKAQIFIDGNYVGVADEYDGFPAFLWLEQGTYDVAIYKPGYQTIFRQYSIYPGVVIDVEDRMQPGEAIHPDEHVSKSTVNRDERIRRNREREAAVEARKIEAVERDRPPVGSPMDESSEIGRMVLDIFPPDAAVYLDGIFLGTAEEVTGLTAGLVVDPGEHLLEVARPGFESREIELNVAAGERIDLTVELDRD